MNLEDTLEQYSSIVENELGKYFESLRLEAGGYHPSILESYKRLEEYVRRKGKRLASCSTLLTYEGYGGKIDEKILRVAVGVEIYRHSILIHDDLADKDETRRGGKSLHVMFSEVHGVRLGEGLSMFIGDIAYALSLEAVLTSGFEKERLLRVANLFTESYRRVNESQILDLLFEREEPSVEEWYTMASKRATSLFTTTMVTGAILGGAPEEDIEVLRSAATHIGYAFDIQDDIIDTFATEQQYGRCPGGDLRKGKKPLHVVLMLELGGDEDLKIFRKLSGKGVLNGEELEILKEMLRRSGALDAAKAESIKHARKAKDFIAKTKMKEKSKKFFEDFTDYITQSLEWYR